MSASGRLIREASEADLGAVIALYGAAGLDDTAGLDEAQARELFRQFARYPSYRLFVVVEAERPETVIGSYALLVMHNLAHGGTSSAIVEDVVVDPQQQGRGVGRQMMAHAMALAREGGCYKLALSSNSKRRDAHAFYESLGFQRHGLSFVVDV